MYIWVNGVWLNKDKILKKTEEKILNILVLTWFIISYTFSPNKKVVTDVIHIQKQRIIKKMCPHVILK